MTALTSSEAFIRALKAPSDLQQPPATSKIELCQLAWATPGLYVPGKAAVIVEWVLLKLREKSSEHGPLWDNRYWSLLHDIVVSETTKTIPTWLSAMLLRLPILPVISSFLSRLPAMEPAPLLVSNIAILCRKLLPLVPPKSSHESVFDMLWAMLRSLSCTALRSIDTQCRELLAYIITVVRVMFAHPATNKIRVLNTFADRHLTDWVLACHNLGHLWHPLRQQLADTGNDILFSIEGLESIITDKTPAPSVKSPQTSVSLTRLFKSFAWASNEYPSAILSNVDFSLLPSLFTFFNSSMLRHKTTLFAASSKVNSTQRPHQASRSSEISHKLKEVAFSFFFQCCTGPLCVNPSGISELESRKWLMKTELLGLLETQGLYDPTNEEVVAFMKIQATEATAALTNCAMHESIPYLTRILSLDYALLSEVVPEALPAIIMAPPQAESIAASFLVSLLAYHCKVRLLHQHLRALLQALKAESLVNRSSHKEVYAVCSRGPLFAKKYQEELIRAIKYFLTPLQTSQVVALLQEFLLGAPPLHPTLGDCRVQPDKKRRRIEPVARSIPSPINLRPGYNAENPSNFGSISRLISIILPVIPIGALPYNLKQEALNNLSDIASCLSEVLRVGMKELARDSTLDQTCGSAGLPSLIKASQGNPENGSHDILDTVASCAEFLWENQIILLSGLRLASSLQKLSGNKSNDSSTQAINTRTDALSWSPHYTGLDWVALAALLSNKETVPELKLGIVNAVLLGREGLHPAVDSPDIKPAVLRCIDFALQEIEGLVTADLVAVKAGLDVSVWDGYLVTLDTESVCIGISIGDLLFGRWMQAIDEAATKDQLARLGNLICKSYSLDEWAVPSTSRVPPSPSGLTLSAVIRNALSSAGFWELPRVKDLLFDAVRHAISGASTCWDSSNETSPDSPSLSLFAKLESSFSLLLHFPVEYVDRPSRVELIKMAMASDMAISKRMGSYPGGKDDAAIRCKTILRTFIARFLKESGAPELGVICQDTLVHLIRPETWYNTCDAASRLREITLDLMDISYLTVSRLGCIGRTLQVLQSCHIWRPFVIENLAKSHQLSRLGLLRLLELFSSGNGDFENLPAALRNEISLLVEGTGLDVQPRLSGVPEMSCLTSPQISPNDGELEEFEILEAWRILVSCKRWINPRRTNTMKTVLFRHSLWPLVTNIFKQCQYTGALTGSPSERVCVAIFGILIKELEYAVNESGPLVKVVGADRGTVFEPSYGIPIQRVIVTFSLCAHVLLTKQISKGGEATSLALGSLSSILRKSCETWPEPVYAATIRAVQESLGAETSCHVGPSAHEPDLNLLVLLRLSDVLIQSARKSTQKPSQELRSSCFLRIAEHEGLRTQIIAHSGAGVALGRHFVHEILSFVLTQCTTKSPALRCLDVSYIWPILQNVMARPLISAPPALKVGDEVISNWASSSSIYTDVMKVIGSLVRYRRDLVTCFLPHLGNTLQLMIMALRRPRGVIGAGGRMGALPSCLPWWMAFDEQLDIEAARELGRVLSNLTTKTISKEGRAGHRATRLEDGTIESQRPAAESLAIPFSKHAGYVLLAYVRCIADDPLLHLDGNCKTALREGIFTLCSMISGGGDRKDVNHGRNWIIERLSGDGRRVMKDLWLEYEKQRYVGRG